MAKANIHYLHQINIKSTDMVGYICVEMGRGCLGTINIVGKGVPRIFESRRPYNHN